MKLFKRKTFFETHEYRIRMHNTASDTFPNGHTTTELRHKLSPIWYDHTDYYKKFDSKYSIPKETTEKFITADYATERLKVLVEVVSGIESGKFPRKAKVVINEKGSFEEFAVVETI